MHILYAYIIILNNAYKSKGFMPDLNQDAPKKKKGLTIISGPTKSGKSVIAEKLVSKYKNVSYIATLKEDITDLNLEERIKIHKERRPKDWRLYHNYKDFIDLINDLKKRDDVILIDSLGGIVVEYLDLNHDQWQKKLKIFINFVQNYKSLIVIVIEETGWGVVPSSRIGNIFRDRLGELSFLLEDISNNSWLAIHGKVINIKLFSNQIYE